MARPRKVAAPTRKVWVIEVRQDDGNWVPRQSFGDKGDAHLLANHTNNSEEGQVPEARFRVVEYSPTEEVQRETVQAIAQLLREKASRVVEEVRPADVREAEDCNLLMASLCEVADLIVAQFDCAPKG